jgi:hypothetical protein
MPVDLVRQGEATIDVVSFDDRTHPAMFGLKRRIIELSRDLRHSNE